MSVLPRFIPDHHRNYLAETLAPDSIRLGPLKTGSRITHTADHGGTSWTVTYLGSMQGDPVWRLSGPGCEHGLMVDTAGVRETITGH